MLTASMNADDKQPHTVRKTVRESLPPTLEGHPHTPPLSATMRIPVDEIFDDFAVRRVSGLEIRMPGSPEPISHPLVNRGMIIGREKDVDIVIALGSISRRHARIFPHNEEFIIEDLGSTNGTFVNGVRVSRCVLRHNDLIRVGDATILFSQQKQWDR